MACNYKAKKDVNASSMENRHMEATLTISASVSWESLLMAKSKG